jgi:RNA polymerase sigma-70 factor (ECF subfamily)
MTRKDDVSHFEETAARVLRRYARGICAGATEEADALVEIALARVASRLHGFDMRESQSGETRVAAYRALTDVARRKGDIAPNVSRHHVAPGIMDALAELPFEERAALLLVSLEGLSYDDAARATGSTREATLERVMRARDFLSHLDLCPVTGARRASGHGHLRVVK